MPAPRPLPLIATAALGLALSGCAAFSDEPGGAAVASGEAPSVVASFYPLQYVAQRVAGDRTEVSSLTQPGGEPHDLELAPRQTAEITEATLLVYESGFQPAVDDSVEQNASGEVLDATEVVDLQPVSEDHADEEHGDEEGHDHADEEHAEEEHAEEEGHSHDDGHDHGDLDPHFWQDPARMADLGDAVADRLADVDPDNADEYAANAADLRTDLEDLDTAYADTLAACERDTVVVSHDAFAYLGKYGLEFESINGLSPGAEPTPADLARLQDLIASDGITTVFSERLVSARLAETLASDAGVETAVLDPVEGLSDETAEEDYLSLMQQNLDALARANGCG